MPKPRRTSSEVVEIITELARREGQTVTRLWRTAHFAAGLAARIVYLKRCARWLLAEQQVEHKADLAELRDMLNTLRGQHGLPPLIRVGFMENGGYVTRWCSLEYTGSGQTSIALPSGMWQRRQDSSTRVECPVCGTTIAYNDGTDEWYHVDTWQHVCPEPYEGVAHPPGAPPTPVAESGATYPTPGTVPGTD